MPSGKIDTLSTIHEECQNALPFEARPVIKTEYKVVMMGSSLVGKTAIVHHFLYDKMPDSYSATVEEFHQGEFEFNGTSLTLDIVDTSGSYPFPAMRRLAITTADAFILVYSVDNAESFEEVRRIREQICQLRGPRSPTVVVGNKCDLPETSRRVRREVAETVVTIDWEHGFVESSAKNNVNIARIFQELLAQAKIPYELNDRVIEKRRKSLPAFATSNSLKEKTLLKRNSCNVS